MIFVTFMEKGTKEVSWGSLPYLFFSSTISSVFRKNSRTLVHWGRSFKGFWKRLRLAWNTLWCTSKAEISLGTILLLFPRCLLLSCIGDQILHYAAPVQLFVLLLWKLFNIVQKGGKFNLILNLLFWHTNICLKNLPGDEFLLCLGL